MSISVDSCHEVRQGTLAEAAHGGGRGESGRRLTEKYWSFTITILNDIEHEYQQENDEKMKLDRMAQLRPTGLAKKLSEQPVGTGEGRPATGRQHMPFSNCCEDFQNQPPRTRLAPIHQPVQIFKILRIVSKQYIHIFIYVYIIYKYI